MSTFSYSSQDVFISFQIYQNPSLTGFIVGGSQSWLSFKIQDFNSTSGISNLSKILINGELNSLLVLIVGSINFLFKAIKGILELNSNLLKISCNLIKLYLFSIMNLVQS